MCMGSMYMGVLWVRVIMRVLKIYFKNKMVGRTTVGAFSPYLNKGIGYVLFNHNSNWVEKTLSIKGKENNFYNCKIVNLPFYDELKKLPRGIN